MAARTSRAYALLGVAGGLKHLKAMFFLIIKKNQKKYSQKYAKNLHKKTTTEVSKKK